MTWRSSVPLQVHTSVAAFVVDEAVLPSMLTWQLPSPQEAARQLVEHQQERTVVLATAPPTQDEVWAAGCRAPRRVPRLIATSATQPRRPAPTCGHLQPTEPSPRNPPLPLCLTLTPAPSPLPARAQQPADGGCQMCHAAEALFSFSKLQFGQPSQMRPRWLVFAGRLPGGGCVFSHYRVPTVVMSRMADQFDKVGGGTGRCRAVHAGGGAWRRGWDKEKNARAGWQAGKGIACAPPGPPPLPRPPPPAALPCGRRPSACCGAAWSPPARAACRRWTTASCASTSGGAARRQRVMHAAGGRRVCACVCACVRAIRRSLPAPAHAPGPDGSPTPHARAALCRLPARPCHAMPCHAHHAAMPPQPRHILPPTTPCRPPRPRGAGSWPPSASGGSPARRTAATWRRGPGLWWRTAACARPAPRRRSWPLSRPGLRGEGGLGSLWGLGTWTWSLGLGWGWAWWGSKLAA